jgi:NADH-quinone oxidoreductase subunit J
MVLFYLFASVAVLASILVVGQRNAMYSVLLLIASFGGLSGLYILLEAPFVAVVQIIVYAGAIMVLFLFVVMLLNVGRESAAAPVTSGTRRLGTLLVIGFGVELAWALSRPPAAAAVGPVATTVQEIGARLFTQFGFAFEITAVLTLVAMLGAVVLTRRGPKGGIDATRGGS